MKENLRVLPLRVIRAHAYFFIGPGGGGGGGGGGGSCGDSCCAVYGIGSNVHVGPTPFICFYSRIPSSCFIGVEQQGKGA